MEQRGEVESGGNCSGAKPKHRMPSLANLGVGTTESMYGTVLPCGSNCAGWHRSSRRPDGRRGRLVQVEVGLIHSRVTFGADSSISLLELGLPSGAGRGSR